MLIIIDSNSIIHRAFHALPPLTNKKGEVVVKMTLTTMGCPLFELISGPIQTSLKKVKGVTDVVVELTFEPPWDPSKMSKEAKVKLGFF